MDLTFTNSKSNTKNIKRLIQSQASRILENKTHSIDRKQLHKLDKLEIQPSIIPVKKHPSIIPVKKHPSIIPLKIQPSIIPVKIQSSIIPLNVYQTWTSKSLPIKMQQNVSRLKSENPEFNFHLFDDVDCREYISNNYHDIVVKCYDKLNPGAYKADLWRLCILYINGGIYMDIKLNCINGFKLMELTKSEHFVKDRPKPLSIYNAFLSCKPQNPFILAAIYEIVENIQKKFYGGCPLSVTGPVLLGKLALKHNKQLPIDMEHHRTSDKCGFIRYNNMDIMRTEYPEYFHERKTIYNTINLQHYGQMWHEKKVYK